MNISEQAAAAIDHAQQGRRVLPLHTPIVNNGTLPRCTCGNPECDNIGKHPRTKHGLLEATTDAETIRAWWRQWPDANIGVATGDGILVVDVDPPDGERSLARLQDDHEPLPATAETITGRGRQLSFSTPPGLKLRNTVSKLGDGLDTRADGGYVVAPPSLHYLGKRYSLGNTLPIAPAPPWLVAELQKPDAAALGSNGHPARISQGRRHNHLLKAAGAMRRKGMSPEAIEKGLLEENAQRCDPPLPEEEVKRIAQDMGIRAAGLLDTTEDGLSDMDFDELFTKDKPVIFAFHGYPWLIHRLTYRRTNHDNIHVRGYKEEGTITTPFDMTVLNDLDRFHLVMDTIDRLPQTGEKGIYLKQQLKDKLIEHKQYIDKYGQDLPEIRNWKWSNPQ